MLRLFASSNELSGLHLRRYSAPITKSRLGTGSDVAHVWFFFVAFGLVLTSYILRYYFYPESGVWGWELGLFRVFRWLTLLIAVICLLFLSIPYG